MNFKALTTILLVALLGVSCRSKTQEPEWPVVLDVPAANTRISSPLKISGKIFPSWLFEGQCTVVLKDGVGKILAQGVGHGDWQSREKYTKFDAELIFQQPDSEYGYLIVQKDNPAGDGRNLGQSDMLVRFR